MSNPFPRCRILPVTDHQVVFLIDEEERLRWHYGTQYPRPFFYPFLGPTGTSLTRMGHPGAPDHDHHRSIWFAHAKLLGIDFWSDTTTARIRQKQWLAYEDGEEEARMAVVLGWYDGHDPKALMEQTVIAVVRPGPVKETFLELQSTFRPSADSLELQKSNFGFLAVRVAKNISVHFGGGTLTNSEGAVGEPAIFAKAARWMDYSGSVPGGKTEGITYFDHPANARQPTHWHVRADGWMSAAFNLTGAFILKKDEPLTLRYLLHAHAGTLDKERTEEIAKRFTASKGYIVRKSMISHIQYAITPDT